MTPDRFIAAAFRDVQKDTSEYLKRSEFCELVELRAAELARESAGDGGLKKSPQADNSLKHGHARHSRNGKASPTYQSWLAMKVRCKTPNRCNSDRYKDKGISVCNRWESFENFLFDMGERPCGTTLDRIDSAGNYEPINCRWATPREQARNTRHTKLTLETATEVALRRLSGETCKSIAADFGICESLPREIVKGRCWPDALEAAITAWNTRAAGDKE